MTPRLWMTLVTSRTARPIRGSHAPKWSGPGFAAAPTVVRGLIFPTGWEGAWG
jgi:hypothetical protein